MQAIATTLDADPEDVYHFYYSEAFSLPKTAALRRLVSGTTVSSTARTTKRSFRRSGSMRVGVVMAAAALVLLGGAYPAAGVGASTHSAPSAYRPKSATVAVGSPIMVEGRVLSETSSDLMIVTPPTPSGCRPPMMCPDFLIAPMRYEIETAGAKYFGPYIGGPRAGDEIVVYGTLVRAATSVGGAPPATVQGFGVISAQGILIISPAPYKEPIPMGGTGTTKSGTLAPTGSGTP